MDEETPGTTGVHRRNRHDDQDDPLARSGTPGAAAADDGTLRSLGDPDPRLRGGRLFIAALRHDGLTAPWVIDAPMNRRLFETYVETRLAPTLRPGDMVILDNLSSHKSEKAKAILKERGAWFLFLPPYSPDLNPIEMACAKLKAHLRKAKARTIEALWQAVGSICELYSPDECWNYLKEAGYVAD